MIEPFFEKSRDLDSCGTSMRRLSGFTTLRETETSGT